MSDSVNSLNSLVPFLKTSVPILSLLAMGLFFTPASFCGALVDATTFPPVDQLPVIQDLPGPLVMNDGSLVKSVEDWNKRREEIKAMILYYEYGHMPPAPDNMKIEEVSSAIVFDGLAQEKRLLLSMGPDHQVTCNIRTVIPKSDHPLPVLAQNTNKLGHIPIEKEILKRGYMIAEYLRTDLDPDEKDIIGCAQKAYPDYDWATLAVWAWGGSRLVDYLYTVDCVDKGKIAMTGHSRGGKTALLAGAMDERIALVAPNGSGCGGAGCYRIEGEGSETLAVITDPNRFAYWFHPRFRTFADKETQLPFDQHFLKALVAPRALLSTEAFGDHWANPLGTQATYLAAMPVFELLGAAGKNGIHFREGKHEHNAEDWTALLDYADLQFFGKVTMRKFNQTPFPKDGPVEE